MKIETVAAGMCATYYPRQIGFDYCLSVAQVVDLAKGEEDNLRYWVEKDRGRAVPLGLGVHIGPDGRRFSSSERKEAPESDWSDYPEC